MADLTAVPDSTSSDAAASESTSGSTPSFLQSVLGWLHTVYPEGVSRTDYYPLLAVLKRTLTEDEVVHAAFSLLKDSDPENPVTAEQIRAAIRETAEKEPTADEVNQVAGRLAMVGWPLSNHS